MKLILSFTLLWLFTNTNGYCQQADTLRVLVLSPNEINICTNCWQEYTTRNKLLINRRAAAAEAKRKEKLEHLDQYNQQPDYTKRMFENDLLFLDSLTLKNYVAYTAREFIAYRLYQPYKIKPRLIFVSTDKLTPTPENYAAKAAKMNVDFIVNFPTSTIEKDKQGLKISTLTELYSRKQKAVVLHNLSIGTINGLLTDYPMCEQGQLDCAFVNSAYESICKCIRLIAESRQ